MIPEAAVKTEGVCVESIALFVFIPYGEDDVFQLFGFLAYSTKVILGGRREGVGDLRLVLSCDEKHRNNDK